MTAPVIERITETGPKGEAVYIGFACGESDKAVALGSYALNGVVYERRAIRKSRIVSREVIGEPNGSKAKARQKSFADDEGRVGAHDSKADGGDAQEEGQEG